MRPRPGGPRAQLRLFPNVDTMSLGKTAIVAEHYDEIVFRDPTPRMLSYLQRTSTKPHRKPLLYRDYKKLEETRLEARAQRRDGASRATAGASRGVRRYRAQRLQDARERVRAELRHYRTLHRRSEEQIRTLRNEINDLESKLAPPML